MYKRVKYLSFLVFSFFLLACAKSLDSRPQGVDLPLSSPSEQGVDAGQLDRAIQRIVSTGSLSQMILSVTVVRNGAIVSETHFQQTDHNTPFNVKSVSKSFLSALTGIAIEQGHIESVDQKVTDFLEPKFEVKNPLFNEMTIAHLLTMQSGLFWDENGPISFELWGSNNWTEFILDLPFLHEPGEVYRYTTAGTHLLSVILSEAIGQSTRSFAEEVLFKPLGIEMERWDRDPQGYHFGGSEMYFTTRDLVKFGLLYLNDGKYGDQQVVSEFWVRESLTRRVRSWGDSGLYGYLWYIKKVGGLDVFYAAGYGGQYVFLIPDLEAVVVVTSTTMPNPTALVFDLLADDILPAFE